MLRDVNEFTSGHKIWCTHTTEHHCILLPKHFLPIHTPSSPKKRHKSNKEYTFSLPEVGKCHNQDMYQVLGELWLFGEGCLEKGPFGLGFEG